MFHSLGRYKYHTFHKYESVKGKDLKGVLLRLTLTPPISLPKLNDKVLRDVNRSETPKTICKSLLDVGLSKVVV